MTTLRNARRGMLLLVLLAALAGGCDAGETAVYTVRGQVVRRADGGRQLVIDHEAVPGRMEAMRMTMPLQDPDSARALRSGDKIRFELTISRGRASIGRIEPLPPDTGLALAPSPPG